MTKPRLRIGLIGTGFMGKAHVFGFTSAPRVFDLPYELELRTVADITPQAADEAARRLGFARGTVRWQDLVEDPDIDVISVTAPNALHKEMSLAAIRAGKHVYCEKPLAPLAQDALEMSDAAEAAGVKTQVGFNYLCNPMLGLAREMIAAGELGEIRGYRGIHCEDYMADASGAFTFRHDPAGGGALADIGSHITSMARFLIGPITEVQADCRTIFPTRPVSPGSSERAPVKVDDMTHALLHFENGAAGSIEANWAATARTMDLSWEITGTKGALAFSQENMNELLLWSGTEGRSGFTRIESGPAHPPYGAFCPAPGHHLGFNDLKVIEVAELIKAHARQGTCGPDFREAYEVQRTIEAMQESDRARAWVTL